jgi:hypothetical protein
VIEKQKRIGRRRLIVGDLVEHINKQHPDHGKIGMVSRLTDQTQTMRIVFVLVEGVERVWFMGDFVKLKGDENNETH